MLLSIIPGLDESISDCECSSFVASFSVKIESGTGESILDVVDEGGLDCLDISGNVTTHELPEHFIFVLG